MPLAERMLALLAEHMMAVRRRHILEPRSYTQAQTHKHKRPVPVLQSHTLLAYKRARRKHHIEPLLRCELTTCT